MSDGPSQGEEMSRGLPTGGTPGCAGGTQCAPDRTNIYMTPAQLATVRTLHVATGGERIYMDLAQVQELLARETERDRLLEANLRACEILLWASLPCSVKKEPVSYVAVMSAAGLLASGRLSTHPLPVTAAEIPGERLGWKRALEKIENLAGEFGSTPAECLAIIGDYIGEALHGISQGKVPEPAALRSLLSWVQGCVVRAAHGLALALKGDGIDGAGLRETAIGVSSGLMEVDARISAGSPPEIPALQAQVAIRGELQCAICDDTWVSGKLGVCPDCGAKAMLAPEGESDWTPCLTCWLASHNKTCGQPTAGPSNPPAVLKDTQAPEGRDDADSLPGEGLTAESRRGLLVAFDALNAIAVGEPPRPGGRRNSHGGSARCDYCGKSLASIEPHTPCPIGGALAALSPLIPPFPDREAWIASGQPAGVPAPSGSVEERERCRHPVLYFGSGGYYVFCRSCPQRWVGLAAGGGDRDPGLDPRASYSLGNDEIRSAESAAYASGLAIGESAVDAAAAEGVRQHGDRRLGFECREAGMLVLAQLRALAGTGAQPPPAPDAGAPLSPFDRLCADRLADEVAVLVRSRVIDSRSPAADALLDYRNPPSSPRADRLAELEAQVAPKTPVPEKAPAALRMPVVIGEASDGWHVALATYPASMDTACGKAMLPATQFETTDAARGHTFCIACLNAWPEPPADTKGTT